MNECHLELQQSNGNYMLITLLPSAKTSRIILLPKQNKSKGTLGNGNSLGLNNSSRSKPHMLMEVQLTKLTYLRRASINL